MKVILKDNIENLGKRGDIVNVARGYARNYLIPKELAIRVTASNKKMIELEQKALRKQLDKEISSFAAVTERLNQVSLTFSRKVAEHETLFGSVSVADIKESLDQAGFEIEKKKILLAEPIKKLGTYTVPVKVFHEDRAEIRITVLEEGAELKEPTPDVEAEAAQPDGPIETEKQPEQAGEAVPEDGPTEAAEESVVEEDSPVDVPEDGGRTPLEEPPPAEALPETEAEVEPETDTETVTETGTEIDSPSEGVKPEATAADSSDDEDGAPDEEEAEAPVEEEAPAGEEAAGPEPAIDPDEDIKEEKTEVDKEPPVEPEEGKEAKDSEK